MGRSNKNSLKKTITKSNYKVGTERKDALEGLPPGWTVDVRVRKSGTKLKYDRYYTDPDNEYVFRSRKEVLLYIETGKIGKYARHSSNRKKQDVTTLFSVSDEAVNDETKLDAQLSISGESVAESSAIGGGEKELSRPFPLKNKSSKKRRGKKATFDQTIPSTQTADIPPIESQSVENGVQEYKGRQEQAGSRKCKKCLELDTPRRVSRRLAAIAAKEVAVMKIPSGTPQMDAVGLPTEVELVCNSTGADAKSASAMEVTHHVEAAEQPPEAKLAFNPTGTTDELASIVEGPDTTHVPAVGPPSGAMLADNPTGTNGEVAINLEAPETTQVAAVELPSEAKPSVNPAGTNDELPSDLEGRDSTWVAAVEPPSGAKPSVNPTGTNSDLASYSEGPATTQVAAVEPASGVNPAVIFTSVDSACMVSAQCNQVESEKAGNITADLLTGEIQLKQEGYQGITKGVSTTTCSSGGEVFFEQGGTSDPRREHPTQSQPLFDHAAFGKLDTKTPADGDLGEPLVSPFGELWTDPCLEFAYMTLTGDIPLNDGEAVTSSDTIPVSDPFFEFACKTPTKEIQMGDDSSTACLDVIPMSDPCIEFAYKTLTGALPVENIPAATFTEAVPTSDPCIEFAYRTLTDNGFVLETREENNHSVPVPEPGAVALSDPCLEFAYKTITGEIPLEDILAYQDFLRQQSYGQTQQYNLGDGFSGSAVKPASLNNLQNERIRASSSESLHYLSNNVVQHSNGGRERDNTRS